MACAGLRWAAPSLDSSGEAAALALEALAASSSVSRRHSSPLPSTGPNATSSSVAARLHRRGGKGASGDHLSLVSGDPGNELERAKRAMRVNLAPSARRGGSCSPSLAPQGIG